MGNHLKLKCVLLRAGAIELLRRASFLKIYVSETPPEQKASRGNNGCYCAFTENIFLPQIQQRTLYWNEFYFKEK